MDDLISLKLEQSCLGALFKFSDSIWPEVCNFITDDCFQDADSCHKVIFHTLRKYLDKNEKFDKIIIANDIKNLGVRLGDLDIFEYCDILSSSQVNKDGAKKLFQELLKLKVLRELVQQSGKVRKFVLENKDKDINEIVGGVDKLNHERIDLYKIDDDPIDLFDGLVDLVYKRAENPQKETGLITGFKEFDRLIGGIRAGDGINSIASRAKNGKSNWLLELSKGVVLNNDNCKVLYLDTEMKSEVNRFRSASAFTDVSMWYLETGNWSKDGEMYTKVRSNINKANAYAGKIYHKYVANKPIEEICSIIRRWYYKVVGSGNSAMIVYDYIKLTGEKLGNNWAEHQAIGEKVNRLNEIGNTLNVAIWTATQMNRSGEGKNRVDDSSAVALSDRIQWFCAFNGIFRRKTLDEINQDGLKFGTHKLIPLATRFQGKDSAGYFDLVNIGTKKEPRYKENFINYNIKNFKIDECGTLRNIVEAAKDNIELSNESISDLI